jgi:hypothetical protein
LGQRLDTIARTKIDSVVVTFEYYPQVVGGLPRPELKRWPLMLPFSAKNRLAWATDNAGSQLQS